MNKYILHIGESDELHAGPKAMGDCEKILLNDDFKLLKIEVKDADSSFNKMIKLGKLFQIKRNSIVIIQHPLYIGKVYLKFVNLLKKIKQVKLIFIVHDLESLRKMFKEHEDHFVELDKIMYEISDAIISHNQYMTNYLIEECGLPSNKIYNLEVFDYLCNLSKVKKEITQEIVIAGNLSKEKCGYLYKLNNVCKGISLELFGINYDEKVIQSKNIIYRGSKRPEELPSEISAKFGLVWDGASLYKCEGTIGEYLKYNNPHKVSLYIASSTPIIIWKKAALASFVQEHQIGITIDSLEQLKDALNDISDETYRLMKNNVTLLSEKVRKGYYLKTVIQHILNDLR